MHLKRRPDHRRPLLYPGQAVAVGVYGGGIEAHAVVPDHQVNTVIAKGQAHGHLLGSGVALHVDQGLIGDAEQGLGLSNAGNIRTAGTISVNVIGCSRVSVFTAGCIFVPPLMDRLRTMTKHASDRNSS